MKISENLQYYISKVQQETNRQVEITITTNVGLSGMRARFLEHPSKILVEIVPNLKEEVHEHSIAHEVTHGLLRYSKGYPEFKLVGIVPEDENQSIGLILTMVEDIVVNKLLQENCFPPFPSTYLIEVRNEIKAMNNGKDYYAQYSDDKFKRHFKLFRYIQAWGFTEYVYLEEENRKILQKFLKSFSYSFPTVNKQAREVTQIILARDIFSPVGFLEAVLSICKLWNLDKYLLY